MSLVYIAKTQH